MCELNYTGIVEMLDWIFQIQSIMKSVCRRSGKIQAWDIEISLFIQCAKSKTKYSKLQRRKFDFLDRV